MTEPKNLKETWKLTNLQINQQKIDDPEYSYNDDTFLTSLTLQNASASTLPALNLIYLNKYYCNNIPLTLTTQKKYPSPSMQQLPVKSFAYRLDEWAAFLHAAVIVGCPRIDKDD